MTPEQLDEIEKLAEAATPGPWKTVVEEFHADSGTHEVALQDCFNEQDAEKNAAFIRAMREHTLPMIKALRESREDVARHKEESWAWVCVAYEWAKERDNARAEVERLRDVLFNMKHDSDTCGNTYLTCRGCEALKELETSRERLP